MIYGKQKLDVTDFYCIVYQKINQDGSGMLLSHILLEKWSNQSINNIKNN